MKNITRTGFITLFALLMLASTAGAYVLKSWRWPSPQATYDDSSLSSGWRTAVRAAADVWEDTGRFDWTRSSSSPNKLTIGRIDGRNGKFATTTHDAHGAFLYKVGIIFDEEEPWYTGSGSPSSSKLDARSIATHEFGHAVGIDHTQKSRCQDNDEDDRPTMCTDQPFYQGDTWLRSLEPDDKSAIKAQYPKKQVTSAPSVQTTCVTSDWAFLSRKDRAREAQTVITGEVTDVGLTLWNTDGDMDEDGALAALSPYHLITITPHDILLDETESFLGSTSVTVMIPAMSPIDAADCGADSVGPFENGMEVTLFLHEDWIYWQSGEKRTFLQTVSAPEPSSLIMKSDGLFYEAAPRKDDRVKGRTLAELHESIRDLRRALER